MAQTRLFKNKSYQEVYQFNQQINASLLEVCQPFMELFGLREICNATYFNDGTQEDLFTNLDCTLYRYQNNLLAAHSAVLRGEAAKTAVGSFRMCTRNGLPRDKIQQVVYDYNLWNGISLYERQGGAFVIWVFNSDRQHEGIVEDYINNIPSFLHFIRYFNMHARENFLGSLSHSPPHLLSGCKIPLYDKSQKNQDMLAVAQKLFKIKKFPLGTNVVLSPKEFECLSLLSKGNSIKEIAFLLCNSPKTIETHMRAIKLKTGQPTKGGLIKLFNDIEKKISF